MCKVVRHARPLKWTGTFILQVGPGGNDLRPEALCPVYDVMAIKKLSSLGDHEAFQMDSWHAHAGGRCIFVEHFPSMA